MTKLGQITSAQFNRVIATTLGCIELLFEFGPLIYTGCQLFNGLKSGYICAQWFAIDEPLPTPKPSYVDDLNVSDPHMKCCWFDVGNIKINCLLGTLILFLLEIPRDMALAVVLFSVLRRKRTGFLIYFLLAIISYVFNFVSFGFLIHFQPSLIITSYMTNIFRVVFSIVVTALLIREYKSYKPRIDEEPSHHLNIRYIEPVRSPFPSLAPELSTVSALVEATLPWNDPPPPYWAIVPPPYREFYRSHSFWNVLKSFIMLALVQPNDIYWYLFLFLRFFKIFWHCDQIKMIAIVVCIVLIACHSIINFSSDAKFTKVTRCLISYSFWYKTSLNFKMFNMVSQKKQF